MAQTWKFGPGNEEKKITGKKRHLLQSLLGKCPLAINFSILESIPKVRKERKSFQRPKGFCQCYSRA